MTKTTKSLKWRLKEAPTSEALGHLLAAGILTKEEARQIILDDGTVEPSDLETIKGELALLRQIVLDLSSRSPQTVIKIIEREVDRWPNYQPHFYNPYTVWCSSNALGGSITVASGSLANATAGSSMIAGAVGTVNN
jgi:hypothetical protein